MKYHYRLADQLLSKSLTIVSVGKDMNKLNSLYNAHEDVKCCIHFGKVWQFLDKLDRYLAYCPAFPLLRLYSGEMKPHKYLCVNIHTSIIFNSQNLETIQMLINEEVDKQIWHIHTMEYSLAIKGMKFGTGNNMNESQNHYIKWKKPDSEDFMFF